MSTIYDYITIDNPSGGTSTTYSGTEISVNTPAISDVTKAEVTLTAKQSLNGYSAPWADGTGINQMTGSNRMRDWEITGSGDIVNFYPYQMSASSPFNLSRLTTDIVPQQSGSGDPSPTNIRPITGFDSASIYSSGKNMLRHIYPSETKNAVTFTENADGSVSTSGTATANAEHSLTYRVSGTYGTCFLKAGTYILSGCPSGGGSTKYEIGINTTINGSGVTLARDYGNGATFTMQNDGLVGTLITIRNGQDASGLTFKPMIEQGSTATSYEKYNGNTYSVSFGSAGTVYGGTLDVVSGQLTVTHKIIDLGTLSWTYKTQGYFDGYTAEVSNEIKCPSSGSELIGIISSQYVEATSNQIYNASVNGVIAVRYSNGDIWIRDTAQGTDAATFKTNMNGVQAVYELATPLTYQLTATQVAMITGNNYIWTNCGTITDAGYKLSSSNNDTLTYLYAPNAGLCTGKMPTTIGLGFTYNYLSFEYYSTQAVDIDVYICGTDAKWYDTTYNRTKYVKWDTFSLPAKTSYTKYTLPTRSISLSDLTEGSGDVNSVYFEIVPTTNTPTYPMRIQHVQFDHNSATTTYVPSQNRCTYSGSSSVTLYKRSTQSSSYVNSYYKYLNTTVYNGSFEYITGKVTKTYASITLNSSDLTWAVYNDSSTSRAFRATISDMKSLSHSSYDSVRCFCTHAGWTSSTERLGFGKFYYSYGYVYFPDYSSKRFNTVDEFTAWLDLQESRGTPVTILYPLSTPAETTLSTTTIRTLAGQNYFDTSSTASSRLPITMTIRQTSFVLPRPANFNVQREDIYAGEYVTCTGATKADRIGWKYSDLDLEWDALEQGYVEALIALTGQATLIFDDPEHDTIEESIVRSSAVATRHRSTLNGVYWWTDVKCSIRFIDAHND